MSVLKPLTEENAPESVKTIYAEIKGMFGFVPNLFKTYAHYEPLLKINWEKSKLMMGEGSFSIELKHCIAAYIAKNYECDYCVAAHCEALKQLGVSRERLVGLLENVLNGTFSDKEVAILEFSKRAALDAKSCTSYSLQKLRAFKMTDREVIELFGIIEMFVGYNSMLEALRVEVDFPKVEALST